MTEIQPDEGAGDFIADFLTKAGSVKSSHEHSLATIHEKVYHITTPFACCHQSLTRFRHLPDLGIESVYPDSKDRSPISWTRLLKQVSKSIT
jgi:hypothetical protein